MAWQQAVEADNDDQKRRHGSMEANICPMKYCSVEPLSTLNPIEPETATITLIRGRCHIWGNTLKVRLRSTPQNCERSVGFMRAHAHIIAPVVVSCHVVHLAPQVPAANNIGVINNSSIIVKNELSIQRVAEASRTQNSARESYSQHICPWRLHVTTAVYCTSAGVHELFMT